MSTHGGMTVSHAAFASAQRERERPRPPLGCVSLELLARKCRVSPKIVLGVAVKLGQWWWTDARWPAAHYWIPLREARSISAAIEWIRGSLASEEAA